MPLLFNRLSIPIIALLLWLSTIILGIIDIFAIWEAIALLSPFTTQSRLIWKDPLIFVLALTLGVFVINSGRFHIIHLNQPRSWRFFAITIGIELVLLGLIILWYFLTSN